MAKHRSDEVDALLERVERSEELGRRPIFERLMELTEPGTEAWALATRELSRILVEREPWRASVLARRVVDEDPEDHLGWALVGLAQSLLGNHAYAASAYERALSLAPENPYYQHNLGHLYDALLGRPHDAVFLLRRARLRLRGNPHVTASLAHALVRTDHAEEARRLMLEVVRQPATAEHHELYRWILDECERVVLDQVAYGEADARRRPVRATRSTKR